MEKKKTICGGLKYVMNQGKTIAATEFLFTTLPLFQSLKDLSVILEEA